MQTLSVRSLGVNKEPPPQLGAGLNSVHTKNAENNCWEASYDLTGRLSSKPLCQIVTSI